jgi:hypothetical protein
MMDSRCLTDAQIAAYVDGLADARMREEVESHLEVCPLCLRSVADVKRLVDVHDASPVPTPDAALRRACEMIEAAGRSLPEFYIVATLKQGLVKILETTGSLLPPPRLEPVPVRSKKRPALIPRVAKSLSGHFVTVELRSEREGFVADVTLVDEESSERPDGVKVKLRTGGSSETKYSRSGKVRFSSLARGVSELDLERIGRIKLEIR